MEIDEEKLPVLNDHKDLSAYMSMLYGLYGRHVPRTALIPIYKYIMDKKDLSWTKRSDADPISVLGSLLKYFPEANEYIMAYSIIKLLSVIPLHEYVTTIFIYDDVTPEQIFELEKYQDKIKIYYSVIHLLFTYSVHKTYKEMCEEFKRAGIRFKITTGAKNSNSYLLPLHYYEFNYMFDLIENSKEIEYCIIQSIKNIKFSFSLNTIYHIVLELNYIERLKDYFNEYGFPLVPLNQVNTLVRNDREMIIKTLGGLEYKKLCEAGVLEENINFLLHMNYYSVSDYNIHYYRKFPDLWKRAYRISDWSLITQEEFILIATGAFYPGECQEFYDRYNKLNARDQYTVAHYIHRCYPTMEYFKKEVSDKFSMNEELFIQLMDYLDSCIKN